MSQNIVDDFTVISTENQTNGKGQLGSEWSSNVGENLTFSVFLNTSFLQAQNQFYLNCAVSISVFNVLKKILVPHLSIKWPNDIMSGNQKICGILVETTFTHVKIKNTVIGVGLNVNQEKFPSHIVNASSLKNIMQREFSLDEILPNFLISSSITLADAVNLISLQGNIHFTKTKYTAAIIIIEKGKPKLIHLINEI